MQLVAVLLTAWIQSNLLLKARNWGEKNSSDKSEKGYVTRCLQKLGIPFDVLSGSAGASPRHGHWHLGGRLFWLVSVLSLVSHCSTLQLGCGAPKPSITLSTTAPGELMVRPGCSWHELQKSSQSLLVEPRWARHKPGVNLLSGHLSNSIGWSADGQKALQEIEISWWTGSMS